MAFAIRYLRHEKKKYSIGELELPDVVWGLERYRFRRYETKLISETSLAAILPKIRNQRKITEKSS